MELVCKHSACDFAGSTLIESRLDMSPGRIYPVEVWQLRAGASRAFREYSCIGKESELVRSGLQFLYVFCGHVGYALDSRSKSDIGWRCRGQGVERKSLADFSAATGTVFPHRRIPPPPTDL